MSSFLHELGLCETTVEANATNTDYLPIINARRTQDTMLRRRNTQRIPFSRTGGRRRPTLDDTSPENSTNMPTNIGSPLEGLKSPVLQAPPDRASPDPNCSICLGKLQNKSFTNSCLHMFCFSCLLQWSKIKAECPLCKQSFKSIIHTVTSMQEYEEYEIPPPAPVRDAFSFVNYPAGYPEIMTLSSMEVHRNLPHGFEPPVPFRYRTTRRPTYSADFFSHSWVIPSQAATSAWRFPRRMASSEFRESVYVQDIWAQPPAEIGDRYRECTPAFYRANQAQVHRLVPWLNRELAVLFHSSTGSYQASLILDLILRYITRYEIRSTEFQRLLRPHIGYRTNHFLHEFYSFASSHFDLIGYDQAVSYQPNPNPTLSIHVSDESDSDIEIISVELPGTSAPSHSAPARRYIPRTPPTSASGIPFMSDTPGDEETVAHPLEAPVAGPSSVHDDSGECEVVGYVKPRHERTPEVIELSSEDEQLTFGQHSVRDNLSQQTHTRISSPESDMFRSSSSSSQLSNTSEYLPEYARKSKSLVKDRKKDEKKKLRKFASKRRHELRESSNSFHPELPQEEVAPSSSSILRARKRPTVSSLATVKDRPLFCHRRRQCSDEACHDRLESSRDRAIASYVRRNLLPDCRSTEGWRSHMESETPLPREQTAREANRVVQSRYNQSSSSVECLDASLTRDLPLLSSTASPLLVDDAETVSTRANHGSVGSEMMPQHGSDEWGNTDSLSESDISLAVLKARSSNNWIATSGASGGYREMRQPREESMSRATSSSATPVISSSFTVRNLRFSSDSSSDDVRKRPKRLRSAILPETSTSTRDSENEQEIDTWHVKRTQPIPDSDSTSSSSDSGETKPRLKSIVITRTFMPLRQGQSSSRSSDDSRKRLKKKAHRVHKHRENSSSLKGKRNNYRAIYCSSDSSS